MKDDLLLNTLTEQSVIQPVIDIVLENSEDDVIDILELLRGDQPSKGANLTTDLSSPSGAAIEFKSLSLKAGQQTELRPASATLLVANNYFIHDAKTLSSDLSTVSTILKDDGYLLVVQPFDGFPSELSVFTAFSDQKKPGVTELPDYEQFKKALSAEGFQVGTSGTHSMLEKRVLYFSRSINFPCTFSNH